MKKVKLKKSPLPLCSRVQQRAVAAAQAAGSSGSRVWECLGAPGGPTSLCCGMFHERTGEAGCGRWEPPSSLCSQRAGME